MGKGSVRVLLRTRPTDNFAVNNLKIQDGETVGFHFPRRAEGQVLNNTQDNHTFRYDEVMHNASQDEVYLSGCKPLVDGVIQGYNATIMAYGQTGAGKTYTMTGGGNFKSRGLTPRAIADVFQDVTHLPEKSFEIAVSYMEIYNEKIYDLLSDEADSSQQLTVHDDSATGVTVKGLEVKAALSESEALSHLFKGDQRRVVGEHSLNVQSSRSHCIFTIHVRSRSRVESDGKVLSSKLNLVDLAGSERVAKTGSEGVLLKEAMHINKSLSFLEQVVVALSSSSRSHVPYRQCKLTNILKDSLGGNCKTVMIANVWAEERHLDETLSTLKFASRMMKVQNEVQINVTTDLSSQLKQLQRQVAELKAELQMQNQLHGKSHIKYDGFSDDERYDLERKVQHYLAGTLEDIEVRSLRDVKEYFKLFKACVERAGADAEEQLRAKYELREHEAAQGASQAHGAQAMQDGVGDVDGMSGFGVGTGAAAKNIRANLNHSPRPPDELMQSDSPSASPGAERRTFKQLPDRNKAYEDFKCNEGADVNGALKQYSTRLRELKHDAAMLTSDANVLKTQIEEVRVQVERFENAEDSDDVVDSERMQLYEDLKKKKNTFRDIKEQLGRMKIEHDTAQKLLHQTRQQLVAAFEKWYSMTYCDGGDLPPEQVKLDVDRLDEVEQHDLQEEERLMREDPDSLQFYRAMKMTQTKRGPGGSHPKRGAGWAAARPTTTVR